MLPSTPTPDFWQLDGNLSNNFSSSSAFPRLLFLLINSDSTPLSSSLLRVSPFSSLSFLYPFIFFVGTVDTLLHRKPWDDIFFFMGQFNLDSNYIFQSIFCRNCPALATQTIISHLSYCSLSEKKM